MLKEPSAETATDAVAQGKAQDFGASETLTFLDLFSGCGGFTLGMQRAGLRCLAAIDFNEQAVATLKMNLPDVAHVLEKDMSSYSPEELSKLVGTDRVDVIVGGPPCQGFSTARQVDGANHGKRLKEDSRRHLYRYFLRYIEYFQPKIFVMENVLGLRTAAGGAYFTAVQNEARAIGRQDGAPGYRVHSQVEDAWELGVPQKRRRQLIIGVRKDVPGHFISRIQPAPRATPRIQLGAAIGDLPILRPGGGDNERPYDQKRINAHVAKYGPVGASYLRDVIEVPQSRVLTNHTARPHNDRDLRDFARLKEGESSAVAMRRGVEFEFPYDKDNFKDRYTRQSRFGPCSTIVAHLSKDGLMFIHPTQRRSLTPREAARVQSFPDWFRFPKEITHSFRLIGNAVPPLVAEAVGLAVIRFLEASRAPAPISNLGKELDAALLSFVELSSKGLRKMSSEQFLQNWRLLLRRFPELHPCNARDHGQEVEKLSPLIKSELEDVCALRYIRTGWPVALTAVGKEAWRRVAKKEVSEEELFHIVD
jgi:DNA (cytosine-5)-methyltransferase 1